MTAALALALADTAADGHYNDWRIAIGAGTGAGQHRAITSYVAGTKAIALSVPISTPPDDSSTYTIMPPAVTITAYDGATKVVAPAIAGTAAESLYTLAGGDDTITSVSQAFVVGNGGGQYAGYFGFVAPIVNPSSFTWDPACKREGRTQTTCHV